MSNINGFDNEFEYVKCLNGKKIKELNPLLRDLIEAIFPLCNSEDIVKCWRNHYKQKSDILIKIGEKIQGISIKMGSRNSVHVEPITSFIHFLIENGIKRDVVIEYLKYHYADGTTNGSGSNRLSVEEYKKLNQKFIDLVNEELNNEKILKKAIERFVTKGTNSKYPIAAIVYGKVNDFLFLTTEDIEKIILFKKSMYSTAVHFGALTVQPKNRCINKNPKYEKDRYSIQIKWYSIFDDIMESMYLKEKFIYDNLVLPDC